jgi:amino acid transporter
MGGVVSLICVQQNKTQVDDKGTQLKKELGLWSLVGLGVGGIIGSGIFGLIAAYGADAGPALTLAIVFVGIIMTMLALVYAELGSRFPLTGGPYSIPRLALGNSAGYLVGWGYFLYAFTGTAAIIDVFVTYAGFYVPGLAVGLTLTPVGIGVALAALGVFTIINVMGVKWGGLFGIVTTVTKLIPLILFAGVGLVYLNFSNFAPFMPSGWTGIAVAMALAVFMFTGFEAVVIPSGEVKNPTKTIPRAMIITMAVVVLVYVVIGIAFVGMINWSGLGMNVGDWSYSTGIGSLSSPLSDVANAAGYGLLAAVITIGAVISTAGAGSDWVLYQGRIPFAMAKDGLFPRVMGRVNGKYGTPAVSIAFAALLTGIIQILFPFFPDVVLLASITTLIPYAAASVSLAVLRKSPKLGNPEHFRLPAGVAVAFLGFVLSSVLIYWATWPLTLVGAVLTLLGFPLYLFAKNKKMEWRRQAWFWVYVAGLTAISFVGDTNFITSGVLPVVGPLGYVPMPYDLVVVALFASLIFLWAYKANVGKTVEDEDVVGRKQFERPQSTGTPMLGVMQ